MDERLLIFERKLHHSMTAAGVERREDPSSDAEVGMAHVSALLRAVEGKRDPAEAGRFHDTARPFARAMAAMRSGESPLARSTSSTKSVFPAT